MTLNDDALIKKDRLRFTRNKLSANLTLLAIVFNALYFVSIYTSDVGSYYYRLIIGASVVYNLLFMLIAFLASEGVKGYKMAYSYVLIALGIGQLIRIFILPMEAKNTTVHLEQAEQIVMGSSQFIWVCVLLVVSAVLCFIAGVVGIIKTSTLVKYQAELENEAKGSET